MRPAFCRIAVSILAAMSGLALRKALAFSRAWSDALAFIGDPAARFLDHARFHPEIDELAALRYAFPVHDVELDLLERRGELVLTTLTRVWLPTTSSRSLI